VRNKITNRKEESSKSKAFSKQEMSSDLERPFGEPKIEVREVRNERFDREKQEE